ncbi:molecular chaperone DnaJ [Burkholderia stagnalis]|uniref:J domain-containing protein n=1 Tax=Burkholderia stagnalis TaxID=1503054 RepID=A0A6L3MYE9_9BURK|nr:J domain-containing protein [Burkholderia stagnalis]AOK55442.1 molecular chaperone DnaJ [Burkholderia stagnalis]KAB0638427.1 J domain-containing protein [Burkholderia stagnalis]KVC58292.1 molecular chaperone DnaJ [Burkholderia stagnalis]KVN09840.1 molecular chaperone DnaJ [Burkholderia stagnalis]KVN16323.1 molecular chaperone DnaJ [Burkholderia stagnalis]
MPRTNSRSVSIASDSGKTVLSKGQKAFNALIKQIEKRRKRLSAWEHVMPAFQKRYVDELLPLERAWTELRTTMTFRLDEASERKGLTKAEQRTISTLIANLAGDLLDANADARLKAIYNRHGGTDYDVEMAAEFATMKAELEAMLGIELDDDLDMSAHDEVLQHVRAKLEQERARDEANKRAREARRAERQKSAKQLAKESQQQAEQVELSQSIRDVYRKLASALHPDREPDPLERERKTSLMQRVNQAYDRNDLLKLLELQLELEHIDQHAINQISEDRLKHYNKILKEQVAELDQEIRHVESHLRFAYGLSPYVEVSPDTVLLNLAREIIRREQDIRGLKEEMPLFDDLGSLKRWLKELKRQQSAFPVDEMPF